MTLLVNETVMVYFMIKLLHNAPTVGKQVPIAHHSPFHDPGNRNVSCNWPGGYWEVAQYGGSSKRLLWL